MTRFEARKGEEDEGGRENKRGWNILSQSTETTTYLRCVPAGDRNPGAESDHVGLRVAASLSSWGSVVSQIRSLGGEAGELISRRACRPASASLGPGRKGGKERKGRKRPTYPTYTDGVWSERLWSFASAFCLFTDIGSRGKVRDMKRLA